MNTAESMGYEEGKIAELFRGLLRKPVDLMSCGIFDHRRRLQISGRYSGREFFFTVNFEGSLPKASWSPEDGQPMPEKVGVWVKRFADQLEPAIEDELSIEEADLLAPPSDQSGEFVEDGR